MTAMSDYLEAKLLDHTFRNVAYVPPTTVYLALFTIAPTDAGGGTEVAGGSYARQAAAFSVAVSPTGRVTNSATITFTNLPAGTVVAAALMDALTVGNLLTYLTLASSRTVVAGDNLTVAIADLSVTFA